MSRFCCPAEKQRVSLSSAPRLSLQLFSLPVLNAETGNSMSFSLLTHLLVVCFFFFSLFCFACLTRLKVERGAEEAAQEWWEMARLWQLIGKNEKVRISRVLSSQKKGGGSGWSCRVLEISVRKNWGGGLEKMCKCSCARLWKPKLQYSSVWPDCQTVKPVGNIWFFPNCFIFHQSTQSMRDFSYSCNWLAWGCVLPLHACMGKRQYSSMKK